MPIRALILFILKADSIIQLYINYRRLNKIIIKNWYLLPLINIFLNRFSYIKIFIKLDFRNIYYKIYIKKGDE